MFCDLLTLINNSVNKDFKVATEDVRKYVDSIDSDTFKDIVKNIGIIPENIAHDSSEEKLYSKASDIVLARCFRTLGLASKALDERGDSADILAESIHGYNYSLVADAKCFRLSRTAKNQKDFKINNLSNWRGSENEYAVLVSPYFQYPKSHSQIYSNALSNNVCLLSWEHISLLIEHGVSESDTFSLESLWNASLMMSRDTTISNSKECFLPKMDIFVAKKIGLKENEYKDELNCYKSFIIDRGNQEILYWESQIDEINTYTRERAIEELITSRKLNEKISVIKSYLNKLKD